MRILVLLSTSVLLSSLINVSALAADTQASSPPVGLASKVTRPNHSGVLFSLGQTALSDINVVSTVTGLGYTGVTGGNDETKMDFSLGYRHAMGPRFSANAQYLRQTVTSHPLGVTVPVGTEATAAAAIAKALPKLAQGVSVTGLYHAPLTSKLSAQVGGGIFVWRGERETRIGTVTATDKDSGTDPVLQVGLGYQASPTVSVEGTVQRFFMDQAVNRLSVGLVYRFR